MGADFATTAVRLGRVVWFQQRLFEVLGGWVASEEAAEAKVLLATHSRHHAWRAQVLTAELPLLGGRPADTFVEPGDGAVDAAVHRLAGLAATGERLEGVYEGVVPVLLFAYRAVGDTVTPVSGGSLLRALRIVERDEMDDLAEGRAVAARTVPDRSALRPLVAELRELLGPPLAGPPEPSA